MNAIRFFAAATALSLGLAGCVTDSENTNGPDAPAIGEARSGEPATLDSQSAALTIRANVDHAFERLDEALALLDRVDLLDSPVFVLPGAEAEAAHGEFNDAPCVEHGDAGSEHACSRDVPEGAGPDEDFDAGELGDTIIDFLDEKILLEAHVESDAGTEVVFLLDPQILCAQDEEQSSTPDTRPEIPSGGEGEPYDPARDPDHPRPVEGPEAQTQAAGLFTTEQCLDFFEGFPVRVRVLSFAEGDVDIDLQFGEERHTPATLEIHRDRLSLSLDLGASMAVVRKLIEAGAEDPDEVELPERLEGTVAAWLQLGGDAGAEIGLGITEPLRLGLKDPVELDLTVGESFVAAAFDPATETVDARLEIGRVQAEAPYQVLVDAMAPASDCARAPAPELADRPRPEGGDFDAPRVPEAEFGGCDAEPAPELDGTLTVDFGGLAVRTVLDGDAERVDMQGVSLGTTTTRIQRDGTDLFTVDLNAGDGHLFDAAMAIDGEDLLATIEPRFDLAVAFFMEAMTDHVDEPAEWMLDDTYFVTLDGAAAPALRVLGAYAEPPARGDERPDRGEEPDGDGGLMVDAGQLTLAREGAPAETVVVQAGQCLAPSEEPGDDGEHGHASLLSRFTASACR